MAAEWRANKMKLWNGEEIEIITNSDGKSVCPVCGYLTGGDWPYFNSKSEDGEIFAHGSHEICEVCHTQFGDSDFVGDYPGMTQQQIWNALREDWLKVVIRTPQMVEQLKNLGVNIS